MELNNKKIQRSNNKKKEGLDKHLMPELKQKGVPNVLKKINSLDVFLHDSKHTYEHMTWEFKTIWQYLNPKGVLISDDTNWNNSFSDFCSEMKIDHIDLIRDKTSTGTFSISIKN